MGIVIQPADLERDRTDLITTFRLYLNPSSDESRFDWLYRQNPYGCTRAWLARDSASGETVGASAAFRRRATINGESKNGWVLGDFCVADKWRTLGPALQLQRATLSGLHELADGEFCYDFPSRQLTAIYRRLGMSPAAQMVRLAKPLRVDQKLQQRWRVNGLARPMSWLGNILLAASDFGLRRGSNWEIAIEDGECGREFTQLCVRMQSANGFEIQRTAEYLNWRYLRHPFFRHGVLTARRAGRLEGYLIFMCEDGYAQIAEWSTQDNPALLGALVRDLVRRLRRAGATTLSAFLLESDARIETFRSMGFWRRESLPVMLNWPAPGLIPSRNWRLNYGDRDS